ncbi:MAG TPA: hypothetical protein VGS97_16005 [Actinocrinis sp.]|uniref:hypothetical protein n=1 Tax=Actinocrinis sp. TaxID=1920516 RepID=UPI002DDCF991|nr:hypothetical protein [Actinocrinis sp.]HEV2345603.1 hypothetical protein [Actinocrinis sp.]
MPENAGLARNSDSASLRPHHVRTLALAGAVVGVVVLPIAAAQATPSQSHDAQAAAGRLAGAQASGQPSATASPSPGAGVQALNPEFCGTARTATMSDGTVRVQACVVQEDTAAAARVYVANGTSKDQLVALNLTRADGTVIQVQCTITAADANGLCATSPTAISGGTGAFNAIAELATVGAPLSAGVVHVESGLVAPAAQQVDQQVTPQNGQ